MSSENQHEGHRKRLKERFEHAPDAFKDHELLELLLFYAIPRKDTNETAHELINRFGSLRGVLAADIREIAEIKGMSVSSAVLIKTAFELSKRNMRDDAPRTTIATPAGASEYAYSLLYGSNREKFYVICLDILFRVIGVQLMSEGDIKKAFVNKREIIRTAMNMNAVYVVLAHNHPNGSALPSPADINMTSVISELLRPLDIKVCDHIIIAGNKCYSFRASSEMPVAELLNGEEMLKQYSR